MGNYQGRQKHMDIPCCCSFIVWNILKFRINFKHAFQVIQFRRCLNRNIWCLFTCIRSFWVSDIHDLHQEDNKVQERNCMRSNIGNSVFGNEWIVDEFSSITESIDLNHDFRNGIQSNSHGTNQLRSWM